MAPREVQPEDLPSQTTRNGEPDASPPDNRATVTEEAAEASFSKDNDSSARDADGDDNGDNIKTDEDLALKMAEGMAEAVKAMPDESHREVESSLVYSGSSGLLHNERKRKQVGTRAWQASLHNILTNERLNELEDQLRALEADVRNLPEDFDINRNKMMKAPVFMGVIKRSYADEFRITAHVRSLLPEEKPALEVLVSDNVQDIRHGADDEPAQGIKRRGTGLLGQDAGKNAGMLVPERLRIRSWSLISHLEGLSRENLTTYRSFDVVSSTASPLLFLRPFRLLFKYEKAIRESVEEVERKIKDAEDKDEDDEAHKGTFNGIEFKWVELLRDLELLIEFLDVDLKPTFELRQSIRDGTVKEIEYYDLWHLFGLGEEVVAKGKKDQAYRMVNYAGGRDPLVWIMENERDRVAPLNGFMIDCCSVRFNGTEYVSHLHNFLIRRYSGRRAISLLEVYPMRLDPDPDALRERLLAQGRYYLEATRQPFYHRMHRGRTLDEPPQDLEGQVIIDTAMALNAEPEWVPTSGVKPDDLTQKDLRETKLVPWCEHGLHDEGCCGSDIVHKDLKMAAYLSDPFLRDYGGLSGGRSADELGDDALLLPNWLHGFVLRLRKWATLKIDDLTTVPFDNDFNQLMISPDHKETILALVETHEKSRGGSDTKGASQSVGTSLDLIKGKGTGLIILLHGEPGVGKTSTAECVADKTKRPLFPITCGDIGETAMDVEAKLQQNFRLAHRWDSVLLLDEADVFLAKRDKTDLRRNAVTSVFLRSLDYYAGILFLTTNRVGGIDPAFKSRIHLSVYYPRLDLQTTISLYEAFLERAKKEQARSELPATFKFKDKEIRKFAKKHYLKMQKEGYNTWNGRQIRNAFQTAIALVEYAAAQLPEGAPKPVLGKAQFKVVAEGSKQFDVYLRQTLQGTDEEIAQRDQWRDDGFELEAPVAWEAPRRRRVVVRAGAGTASAAAADGRKGTAGSRTAALRRDVKEEVSSEDDSESESEDDSDDSSDDSSSSSDDEPVVKEKNGKGKKKDAKASSAKDEELEELEEFRRYQARKKAKSKS